MNKKFKLVIATGATSFYNRLTTALMVAATIAMDKIDCDIFKLENDSWHCIAKVRHNGGPFTSTLN